MPDDGGIEDFGALAKAVKRGDDLRRYARVNVVASPEGDLLLLNYSGEMQIVRPSSWTWLERVSRGLILDAHTGEVVARPFDKFFNWGEEKVGDGVYLSEVTEKIDGSLGIVYWHKGSPFVATRGSFPGTPAQVVEDFRAWSEKEGYGEVKPIWEDILANIKTLLKASWRPKYGLQATWATDFLQRSNTYAQWRSELRGALWSHTMLVEIVYPENRVVVDYAGRQDLVLLGIRDTVTGTDLFFYDAPLSILEYAVRYGLRTPQLFSFNNVGQIIEAAGKLDANQEGYVLRFSNGQRFKIKGDHYLEIHRVAFGATFKRVLAAVRSGTLGAMIGAVPEEFLGQVRAWQEEIETVVTATKARCSLALSAAPKNDRKTFALWVQENYKEDADYLFALYDGRSIDDLIYKHAFQKG